MVSLVLPCPNENKTKRIENQIKFIKSVAIRSKGIKQEVNEKKDARRGGASVNGQTERARIHAQQGNKHTQRERERGQTTLEGINRGQRITRNIKFKRDRQNIQ